MEPIALWVLIPFVLMLLGIAIGPLVAPRWWEKDVNKILYYQGMDNSSNPELPLRHR